MTLSSANDGKYLKLVLDTIEVCLTYQPRFGSGGALSLSAFEKLYQSDLFYHWMGLDQPQVYFAHRAAGGITSLYRQIGIACQRLFCAILQDELGLSGEDLKWSYKVPDDKSGERVLSLDARIPPARINDEHKRRTVEQWLKDVNSLVHGKEGTEKVREGAVFEIRQGYKSKDAKRQNADLAHAARAYASGYLPVFALFSSQVDVDVEKRYRQAGWAVLRGYTDDDATKSTYAFMRKVIGFDLAAFFERHTDTLREHTRAVLDQLLGKVGT